MNKLKYHFQFDFQLIKGIYTIPFIGYLLTLVLMFISYPEGSNLPYIFLQGIAIPLAGLHLVFLYSSIYDEGATDTLLPYYSKNIAYDFLRYGIFHGLIILLLMILLIFAMGIGFFNFIMIIHLILLFVFYQLIGVGLLTLVKSLEIAIAIIAMYTVIEISTVILENYLPWPHLFIFEKAYYNISLFLTFFFLITGILLSIAQIVRTFK